MLTLPVYLDNHATTRVDLRVLAALLPWFSEDYGNAASHHAYGARARAAVDRAREQTAALIGAAPREIVFTSGATESNNLAIKGAAALARDHGDHLVTAATEHRAVLDPCRRLEKEGFRLTVLPVDAEGRVTAEQVAAALTERTVLVSIMAANNEVGTVQPIAAIGRLCKERGVLFHTDAVQAAGKIPLDVDALGVDLLSLSAHKMYGPKGVGALYVRASGPRVRLAPLFDGGGHERGLRSGTLDVPGVVGLGEACELAAREMAAESPRVAALRDRLQGSIQAGLDEVFLNGPARDRLPGNLNLCFAHVDGNALLIGLRNLAVSSGSACTSADPEPSHVLRAMGLCDERAQASLRFGLGRFTTQEEVDFAAGEVVRVVRRLREQSPLYDLARHGG